MQSVEKWFKRLVDIQHARQDQLCAHTLKQFNKLNTDNNVFTVVFWAIEGAPETKLHFFGSNICGLLQCVVYDQGTVVFLTIAYGKDDISRP